MSYGGTVDTPAARWALSGECLVAVVRPGLATLLPPGLHAVPGPRLVLGARYDQSPVGPYLELAVCEPARIGARIGMCVTTMVVNTVEARRGGRVNWGLPKELGTLDWSEDGDVRILKWADRDMTLRATPVGPPLPTLVPLRLLQRMADEPMAAAARLKGRGRLARVEVELAADDPLAWIGGSHAGSVVSSARLVMGEALPVRTHRVTGRYARPAAEPALSLGHNPGD